MRGRAPFGQRVASQVNRERIDEEFSQRLPDGCRYHGSVEGVVRRAGPREAELVRPDLRVSASLRCPDSPVVRTGETRVRARAVTRAQLGRAISRQASVVRATDGAECMYTLQVRVDRSGGLRIDTMRYQCSPPGTARGGGP